MAFGIWPGSFIHLLNSLCRAAQPAYAVLWGKYNMRQVVFLGRQTHEAKLSFLIASFSIPYACLCDSVKSYDWDKKRNRSQSECKRFWYIVKGFPGQYILFHSPISLIDEDKITTLKPFCQVPRYSGGYGGPRFFLENVRNIGQIGTFSISAKCSEEKFVILTVAQWNPGT